MKFWSVNMLVFTDIGKIKHVFDLNKFVHMHVREVDEKVILTMHMVGPHVVPVTVDIETAERVLTKLNQGES